MAGFVSHSVFIVATWVAAIFGGIGIGAAFVSAIVGYQLTENALSDARIKISEADARAKEADARAKEAELALAKFRAPRLPTREQLSLVAERLRPFAGTKFDIGLSASSGEQADFIWRLELALANFEEGIPNAGWIEVPWGFYQVGQQEIRRGPHRPPSGSVAAQNVEIHLHPESREKLLPAATALISVLKEIDIEAKDAGFNAHTVNVDAIHILIGEKR